MRRKNITEFIKPNTTILTPVVLGKIGRLLKQNGVAEDGKTVWICCTAYTNGYIDGRKVEEKRKKK